MENQNLLLSYVDKFVNEDVNNDSYVNLWNENPMMFLNVLCHIRKIKNSNNSRYIYFNFLKFLKNNFPKTYNENIKTIIATYGSVKDLLIMSRYKIRDDTTNIELNILMDLIIENLSDNGNIIHKYLPRENHKFHIEAHTIAKMFFPTEKNCMELYRKIILNKLAVKSNNTNFISKKINNITINPEELNKKILFNNNENINTENFDDTENIDDEIINQDNNENINTENIDDKNIEKDEKDDGWVYL